MLKRKTGVQKTTMRAIRFLKRFSLVGLGAALLGPAVYANSQFEAANAEFFGSITSRSEDSNHPDFCIVRTQCVLVHEVDSMYLSINRGLPEKLSQKDERDEKYSKDEVFSAIDTGINALSSIYEIEPDELQSLIDTLEGFKNSYSNRDQLEKAIDSLPERVRVVVEYKLDRSDKKSVTSTRKIDYGNRAAGGGAATLLILTDAFLIKFLDIYQGALQCSSDLRIIENIPRCDE